MNKFCPQCGKEVAVEIKNCPNCGTAMLPEWEIGVRKEIIYLGTGCGGCLTLILGIVFLLSFYAMVPSILALIISGIASAIPCVLYILAILWLDRHEKEPAYLIGFTIIWGAFVAFLFAIALNSTFGDFAKILIGEKFGRMLQSVVIAPIIEEGFKGAALLVLFFIMRHEFDNVTDGIIYGSLIGMGFTLTEDMLYYAREYRDGGLTELGSLFLVRSILSGLGHSLYTGTTGAGLGFARQTNKGPIVKITVVLAAFGLAVFFHSMWNLSSYIPIPEVGRYAFMFIVMPIKTIILTAPIIITLLAIAYFALRQEKKVIKEYLVSELKDGVVLPEEYEVLTRGGRLRKEWEILWEKGIASWYYLRKVYQLEVNLAFRRWHTARGETLKGIQRRFSEPAIRSQIASIRSKLI